MPANVLSLDMDWFNRFERDTLTDDIDLFFKTLKRCCEIPQKIDLVPEHQYLFPWGMNLLDGVAHRKVNIVNIDEHHDFYYLNEVDFSTKKSIVTCANFFGFMAHRKMIGEYIWVSTAINKTGVSRDTCELRGYMRQADSSVVRRFRNKVKVFAGEDVYEVLEGRKFDGFIIVRSPQYTLYRSMVYKAVDRALKTHFSAHNIRRHSCRREYQQGNTMRISRQFAAV